MEDEVQSVLLAASAKVQSLHEDDATKAFYEDLMNLRSVNLTRVVIRAIRVIRVIIRVIRATNAFL